MDITIKDKTYKVKYTLRALFIYESVTGETFNIQKSVEQYLFFFCLLLANNPEMTLQFQDFIDACDEDASIGIKFQQLLVDEMQKQEMFLKDGEKDVKKK